MSTMVGDAACMLAVLVVSVVLAYYGFPLLDRFHQGVVVPGIHAFAAKERARKPAACPQEPAIAVPWTSALPRDVVRRIASMSDGRVRLACRTMKEGFDEAALAAHRPFTDADVSKFVFVTGLCRWMSRVDGTLSAKFVDASLDIKCAEPDVVYKLIAGDMFTKPTEMTVRCFVDPGEESRMAVCSCAPRFRGLQRIGWWRASKCKLSFVALDDATCRAVVSLTLT